MKFKTFLAAGLLCVAGSVEAQTSTSTGSFELNPTPNAAPSLFSWAVTERTFFLQAEEDPGYPLDHPVTTKLKNTSTKPISFKFYRTQKAYDESLTTEICLGVCYASWIDSSLEPKTLEPGATEDVIIHFGYTASSKDSIVTYLKIAAVSESPADTMGVRFVAHVTPMVLGVTPKAIQSNRTEIVGVYPSTVQSGKMVNALVNLADLTANGSFTVYDVMGRAVQTSAKPLSKGENTVQISTANLAAGRYFLSLSTNAGGMDTKPFEVVR